jgi:hypothetical protein
MRFDGLTNTIKLGADPLPLVILPGGCFGLTGESIKDFWGLLRNNKPVSNLKDEKNLPFSLVM